MSRKLSSLITLIAYITLTVSSCGDNSIFCCNDNETIVGIFDNIEKVSEIKLSNPGQLHNDVLIFFHYKHNLKLREDLSCEEFIALAVESINTVFESHEIKVRIIREDIITILKRFENLKNEGIIDLFNPTRDGLINCYDYIVEKGIVDKKAAKQYLDILLKTEDYDCSDFKKSQHMQNYLSCVTDDAARDHMYLDVLSCSYEFWTGIDHNTTFVTVLGDTVDTLPDGDDDKKDFWQKIFSYGTDAAISLVSIAMIPLTIGVSIGTLIASILASLVPNNDWFWDSFWGTITGR